MITNLSIASKIYRLKNCLTQEDLADKLGLSAVTISNIETGKYEAKNKSIKAYAKLFNMSVEDIYTMSREEISDDSI